jgi:hypothetical protein
MDKPADPATPFGEVYQSFLDDLAPEGTEPTIGKGGPELSAEAIAHTHDLMLG